MRTSLHLIASLSLLTWPCAAQDTSASVAKPAGIPETWSKIGKLFNEPFLHGRGLDARPGRMGGGAMEINTVPRFDATDAQGITYTKLPKLQFPVDAEGRAFLVQDVTYYSNAECSEDGECIGYISQGEWVRYEQVDFGAGCKQMTVRAASATQGGLIELRLDSPTGELLGALNEAKTALVATKRLGLARIPQLPYQDADGSKLEINTDYFSTKRNGRNPTPGPFESPSHGSFAVVVRKNLNDSPLGWNKLTYRCGEELRSRGKA